jgi:hypothetical protein
MSKVTKREFVKAAAASAAVALAALVRRRSAENPPATDADAPAASFDVIVYNNWFPQAHEFATRFPAARALAVGGDAGQLWYATLRGLVSRGVRRIAGLTTHTDLLILETLAREHGLKVRSRTATGRLVTWVLL